MKIEKLTAKFPEYVQRWTAIGLSTEPACRDKAEAAIRDAYAVAGLKPPRKIVWCGSPLSQGLTRAIILDKKLGNYIHGYTSPFLQKSSFDLTFVLDYMRVVSYY